MKYSVTGMSCAACSARVEKAVKKVPGVTECNVNLLTNSMDVSGTASENDIISAVRAAGYGASAAGKKEKPKSNKNESKSLLTRLIWSLVLMFILMYFSMGHMWGAPMPEFLSSNPTALGLLQMILAGAVTVINQKFFISGFKGAINGAPNMDTLVSLGSGISFVYSTVLLFLMTAGENHLHGLYFESAAMILALIDVGKLLESYSKGRTTDAINALIDLKPKTARILKDGEEVSVPVEEVRVGDIFTVKAGESIPCDGIVLEGTGAVDESVLTGESIPVDKTEGSSVSAATVNKSGFLKCRVASVGEDTMLAKIIKTVADAAGGKAPIAKLADKVSGVFVPVVLGIAAVTFIVWLVLGQSFAFALERGISVLVISCPCALGLATPVAIMVGSGLGAKNGILYKTAASLEEAGRIQNIVLDKTGTVTSGEPKVTDIIPLSDELLKIACSLESKSEHPLAKAVVDYCTENGVEKEECTDIETLSGSGVRGRMENSTVCAGKAGLIENIPEEIKAECEKLASAGKTPLYFSKDGKCLGAIAVADTVKDSSREAIADMKKMGLNVYMLTGDNELTAREVGRQVGIDNIIAGVLPDKKAEAVMKIKATGKTAMVGDGINDAPALKAADLGIAIGNGTDIAIDSADVVLLKSTLTDAKNTIVLGRKVLKNIKENLFWAFFYNCIGIPLAAGVLIFAGIKMTPMLGAAAMSLSSFCVCMNALRLNTVKLNKNAVKANDNIKENKKMKEVIKVNGMMCAHCEGRVKKAFEALPQVTEAVAEHSKGTVVLTLNAPLDRETIKKTVEDAGYEIG